MEHDHESLARRDTGLSVSDRIWLVLLVVGSAALVITGLVEIVIISVKLFNRIFQ